MAKSLVSNELENQFAADKAFAAEARVLRPLPRRLPEVRRCSLADAIASERHRAIPQPQRGSSSSGEIRAGRDLDAVAAIAPGVPPQDPQLKEFNSHNRVRVLPTVLY